LADVGKPLTHHLTDSCRRENVGMRCRDEIGTKHYNKSSGARISSCKKDKEKSYVVFNVPHFGMLPAHDGCY